jgi:hypothetical protein
VTLTPEQKRKVDESLDRNLMILAGEARRIGLEEAIGVLKLCDSKEQALATLSRRIERLRRLKAQLDFVDDTGSEPVYINADDEDRDN